MQNRENAERFYLSAFSIVRQNTFLNQKSSYLCVMVEHECVDEDKNYHCDICDLLIVHTCVDGNKDCICDLCGEQISHECVDEDTDYICDLCHKPYGHECKDLNGDYRCDTCGLRVNHWDPDYDGICDDCGANIAHECLDSDGDDRCDICGDVCYHECIDKDGDYRCDLCGDLYRYHYDGDKDGLCDDCGANIAHDCVDKDGDDYCDICDAWCPHTCADKDEDYHCDICDELVSHDLQDKDCDHICDLCGEEIYFGIMVGNKVISSEQMSVMALPEGAAKAALQDILDVFGDGTVIFQISTGTLTLNNANITGNDLDGSIFGIYAESNHNLKLVLKGKNTITVTATEDTYAQYGIGVMTGLNISGDGELNIVLNGKAMSGGIIAVEKLVIESGNLTVDGSNAEVSDPEEQVLVGLAASEGTLEIRGGQIKIIGIKMAVLGMKDGLEISDSLTVTGGQQGSEQLFDAVYDVMNATGEDPVVIAPKAENPDDGKENPDDGKENPDDGKENPDEGGNPASGDETPLLLLAMLMIGSAAAVVLSRKKFNF